MSPYQKSMSLALYSLQTAIDESKIVKLIDASIKEIEKGGYLELKGTYLDASVNKILVNISAIETLLDDFLLKKGRISQVKNFLFNDTFGSLHQFKLELMNRFNCHEFKLTPHPKVSLDCLLIHENRTSSLTSNIKERNNGHVMIICGPNASSYELFAYSDKWIECYLGYGINVLLWNYRGFGESTGSIDFDNMKSDAEYLIGFLKQNFTFSSIGVHGISIGGVPACHLAGRNLVQFCFADRTFSSINDFARYPFWFNCEMFYKLLCLQESDNVEAFLSSHAFKVISSDPNDQIVNDLCSLKSGVANKVYIDYLSKVNPEEKKKEILRLILNESPVEYTDFVNSLHYVLIKIQVRGNSPSHEGTTEIRYEKLNEESTATTSGKESRIVLTNDAVKPGYSESKVLLSIRSIIERFDAGGETLLSITKVRKRNINKFLNNFFTSLLIWGSYKIGNVYATDKLIIYRAVSKKLLLMNQKISKILNNTSRYSISDSKFSKNLRVILQGFIKIESYFNNLLFKNFTLTSSTFQGLNHDSTRGLMMSNTNSIGETSKQSEMSISVSNEIVTGAVESYRSAEISDFIKNANIGNLLPLECGHNGLYSTKELEMYSLFLLNSKFIN